MAGRHAPGWAPPLPPQPRAGKTRRSSLRLWCFRFSRAAARAAAAAGHRRRRQLDVRRPGSRRRRATTVRKGGGSDCGATSWCLAAAHTPRERVRLQTELMLNRRGMPNQLYYRYSADREACGTWAGAGPDPYVYSSALASPRATRQQRATEPAPPLGCAAAVPRQATPARFPLLPLPLPLPIATTTARTRASHHASPPA